MIATIIGWHSAPGVNLRLIPQPAIGAGFETYCYQVRTKQWSEQRKCNLNVIEIWDILAGSKESANADGR